MINPNHQAKECKEKELEALKRKRDARLLKSREETADYILNNSLTREQVMAKLKEYASIEHDEFDCI